MSLEGRDKPFSTQSHFPRQTASTLDISASCIKCQEHEVLLCPGHKEQAWSSPECSLSPTVHELDGLLCHSAIWDLDRALVKESGIRVFLSCGLLILKVRTTGSRMVQWGWLGSHLTVKNTAARLPATGPPRSPTHHLAVEPRKTICRAVLMCWPSGKLSAGGT
ncbi:hypothetical protein H1C71_014931 [Ictidomys tridecemlineatus]|nr:hypothetical protein H1C71_014931 [Ictidomys tridecemlineatus]